MLPVCSYPHHQDRLTWNTILGRTAFWKRKKILTDLYNIKIDKNILKLLTRSSQEINNSCSRVYSALNSNVLGKEHRTICTQNMHQTYTHYAYQIYTFQSHCTLWSIITYQMYIFCSYHTVCSIMHTQILLNNSRAISTLQWCCDSSSVSVGKQATCNFYCSFSYTECHKFTYILQGMTA